MPIRTDGSGTEPPFEVPPGDVAVLTSREPLPYETLLLAQPEDDGIDEPGANTLIMGWGATSDDDPNGRFLLQGNVHVRADDDCVDFAGDQEFHYDPQAYVCTKAEHRDVHALGGDSGGPLVIDGKLAGVVSWAPAPETGGYTMFTRMTTYGDDVAEALARQRQG